MIVLGEHHVEVVAVRAVGDRQPRLESCGSGIASDRLQEGALVDEGEGLDRAVGTRRGDGSSPAVAARGRARPWRRKQGGTPSSKMLRATKPWPVSIRRISSWA
jgi:hypothetical protein